jgi:L-ascorbate metabolism protein UlaG (beta-lactamase superfamily)
VITAFAKDEQLLAEIEQPIPEGALRIWWLGQSGYLLRYGDKRLLIDPYLSDSLTRKYAQTDKPHVRMTERVIAPERLRGIDIITSSHNHTDHLDAETLLPLLASNPEAAFIIPEANRHFVAERLKTDLAWPVGLNDDVRAVVGGIEVEGIAAAHNALDRDASGNHLYLGYVIRCGRWTIYHSGDTLLYPELAARLRHVGGIDIALLPINGNKPERRVAGNLDGREAARLANEIGAAIAVPCHYDMFEFNTADPTDAFIPECQSLGKSYKILRAGESLTLST